MVRASHAVVAYFSSGVSFLLTYWTVIFSGKTREMTAPSSVSKGSVSNRKGEWLKSELWRIGKLVAWNLLQSNFCLCGPMHFFRVSLLEHVWECCCHRGEVRHKMVILPFFFLLRVEAACFSPLFLIMILSFFAPCALREHSWSFLASLKIGTGKAEACSPLCQLLQKHLLLDACLQKACKELFRLWLSFWVCIGCLYSPLVESTYQSKPEHRQWWGTTAVSQGLSDDKEAKVAVKCWQQPFLCALPHLRGFPESL